MGLSHGRTYRLSVRPWREGVYITFPIACPYISDEAFWNNWEIPLLKGAIMTDPDRVYMSLSFGNISRETAEAVRAAAEQAAGDTDFSVDYGTPIGADDVTPVADEVAAEVGGDPTAAPVVPDVEPTPAPDVVQVDTTASTN